MLLQWPDKFYHTSADTPDRVSPGSLARSGSLAAAYAYWIATAGYSEARWLGHWMTTRFSAQAGRDSVETFERLCAPPGPIHTARTQLLADCRHRIRFREERMSAALETLVQLDRQVEPDLTEMKASIREASARELRWIETQFDSNPSAVPAPAEQLEDLAAAETEWRDEAKRLIPRRIRPGPADAVMAVQAWAGELLPGLWALTERGGEEFHDVTSIAEYWADGSRSIAAITALVSQETGRCADDLLLRYFKLLARAGLVELHESS
jgi:hypothetical protein